MANNGLLKPDQNRVAVHHIIHPWAGVIPSGKNIYMAIGVFIIANRSLSALVIGLSQYCLIVCTIFFSV